MCSTETYEKNGQVLFYLDCREKTVCTIFQLAFLQKPTCLIALPVIHRMSERSICNCLKLYKYCKLSITCVVVILLLQTLEYSQYT